MTERMDGAMPPDRPSDLETYIRENRASFTEDALRRQALAAGHPPEAVEAILAATRSAGPRVDRGRVVQRIFLTYLAVYLILDVLMLINPANQGGSGFLGDVRGIGILFLSMALGGAFIASLVWVGSRRLFWALVGAGIVVASLSGLRGIFGGDAPPDVPLIAIVAPLVAAVVGAGLAVAAARVGRSAAPASPSTELLMVVPLLLLLAIGGTCVVSGLPIPRPA
jgi:hypothetical protein